MIVDKQFYLALDLLAMAEKWANKEEYLFKFHYVEFGWLYIYNDAPKEALNHILNCYKSKAPDQLSLGWLMLAAWLSGDFFGSVDSIAKVFCDLNAANLATAFSACAILGFCNLSLRDKLISLAYPVYEDELTAAARELGLSPPDFRLSLPIEVVHTIIRSLDIQITGGKNSELIG